MRDRCKKNRLIALCSGLFLSGCMVGPDYHPPVVAMPDAFSENIVADKTECVDEDLAHWWTFFHDPFLDSLLAESFEGSFDWKIALEQICQARASYKVQTTAYLPEISSDVQITRSRTSQSLTSTRNADTFFNIPPIQTFYQAGLDVIWQIDLFGGLRRASLAAYDQWEATIENARGVRIVVLSEVALTYTNICALQQAREIAAQAICLGESLLELNTSLEVAGLSNEQNVAAIFSQLETQRADLLVLEINLRQAIYSLAVLIGRPPESLLIQFQEVRPIPRASGRVPIGLPSELLRRRPDIRQAERLIAAATEEIGVAVANLFPTVALTGSSASFSANPLQGANAGFASNSFSKWFTSPSQIWGLGFIASMPIFDFGKRLAMIDQEASLQHQALLNYEKTVIIALQEVESALVAYFNEEHRFLALTADAEARRRILDLNADLYQAGLTNLNTVLAAQQDWLNAATNQLASQQALANDLILLYKALGGGWECSYMP
jgi:multidrug efflux system outer membrane protein